MNDKQSDPLDIFDGVDEVIDETLGVLEVGDGSPHYRHRTSLKRLSQPPKDLDPGALVGEIYSIIEQNWMVARSRCPREPSVENWRFTRETGMSERAPHREVVLEKTIARDAGTEWANQVPVASGLIDSVSNKRNAIDLVHRARAGVYEFIELKTTDNTALFAAFEILRYGLVYGLTRLNMGVLGAKAQSDNVLDAREIHLRVLAPTEYYKDAELAWLEAAINCGLKTWTSSRPDLDLVMSFRFDAFPEDFEWTKATRSADPVRALEERRAVYGE